IARDSSTRLQRHCTYDSGRLGSGVNVQRLQPLLLVAVISEVIGKIGAEEIFPPKRKAPSLFSSRLSRCRLTFTKPPIPPNRSVPSRLSKASTMSRFAASQKLAKERGV